MLLLSASEISVRPCFSMIHKPKGKLDSGADLHHHPLFYLEMKMDFPYGGRCEPCVPSLMSLLKCAKWPGQGGQEEAARRAAEDRGSCVLAYSDVL